MADMVDLKSSKQEMKKESVMMKPGSYKPPPYPYGTTIELRDDHVKKFPGLEDCEAGQEVTITAKAKIININESSSADVNSKQESCEVRFQLTNISIDYPQPKTKEANVSVKSKGGRTEYQTEG